VENFMRTIVLAALLGSSTAWAGEPEEGLASTSVENRHYVWSIEPIKLSSLMLNVHPDWAAFGLETGVRVHRKIWIQSFMEIDKGSLHQEFSTPSHDFLTNHHYTAWLTTGRWVFRPDARHGGFAEAGMNIQWLWQQYNNPAGKAKSRTGMTIAPVLLAGYEWQIGPSNAFFKIRGGGAWNAHRQGEVDGHLDLQDLEEQKRGYYSPYTHLTEVFFQPFYYIGDVSFGFKFGTGRRKANPSEQAQLPADTGAKGRTPG